MSNLEDRLKSTMNAIADEYLRDNPADLQKARDQIYVRRRRYRIQSVALSTAAVAAAIVGLLLMWAPDPDTGPHRPENPVVSRLGDINWESGRGDLGGVGDQAMLRVTAGDRSFLAVGYDASEGDRDAALWESSDGREWSRVWHEEKVLGGPGDQVVYGIQRFGEGYVAAGSDSTGGDLDAAVWISTDGISWKRVASPIFDSPGDQQIYRIARASSGLVALGYDSSSRDRDAAMWLSSDGVGWWRKTGEGFAGAGSQTVRSAAIGPAGIVAVGHVSNVNDIDASVWSSDGVNWKQVVDEGGDFGGTGNQDLRAIAFGRGGIVVGGEDDGGDDTDAALWKSPDGKAWVRASSAWLGGSGDQVVRDLAWSPVGWVAIGGNTASGDEDAAVWVSSDGLNWGLLRLPIFRSPGFQRLQSVIVARGRVVVVGWAGSAGAEDALTWTAELP